MGTISAKTALILSLQIIGIGGSLTAPPLPHHRTCGSASGGSAKLAKQNFALGDFSFR